MSLRIPNPRLGSAHFNVADRLAGGHDRPAPATGQKDESPCAALPPEPEEEEQQLNVVEVFLSD